MIIYIDMVADLIHVGHLRAIKYIKNNLCKSNDKLYVGILSDKDTESYKRIPIINENDRFEMMEGIKYIDKVIKNAPLIPTQEFINEYNIDKICIPNNRLNSEIEEWYKFINSNIIVKIPYCHKISTTDIIQKIKYIN
jgi:cytidyltransferase-like protein